MITVTKVRRCAVYRENYEKVCAMVRERRLIWPANEQLDAMGQLDLHKNKNIWNGALKALQTIPLWEEGAPGFDRRDPDQLEPMLAFLPAQNVTEPRGTILVSHGGAMVCRAGHEGFHTAAWFAGQGFNTAVLSYRLRPYTDHDSLADIQRAVRLLRSKQQELGITDRVAVLGYSAGGYLSALCSVHNDPGKSDASDPVERFSCRPDVQVLCYGARAPLHFAGSFGVNPFAQENRVHDFYFEAVNHITPETPPAFLWMPISDDPRHAFVYGNALTAAGVRCEIHCYDSGFHGVGLADGNNDGDYRNERLMTWADLCKSWLEQYGI